MTAGVEAFLTTQGIVLPAYAALLLIALLVRAKGDRDACVIALIAVALAQGAVFALGGWRLDRLVEIGMLHDGERFAWALLSPDYGEGRLAARAAGEGAVVPGWAYALPVLLCGVVAILLPGRWKALAPIGAAVWLVVGMPPVQVGPEGGDAMAELAAGTTEDRIRRVLAAIRSVLIPSDDQAAGGAIPEARSGAGPETSAVD